MAFSEATHLKTLRERNECPSCHNKIPPEKRVGSGQNAGGVFCSLDCYAKYHALELIEKANRIAREVPDSDEF
jgi:hypothetical protein